MTYFVLFITKEIVAVNVLVIVAHM